MTAYHRVFLYSHAVALCLTTSGACGYPAETAPAADGGGGAMTAASSSATSPSSKATAVASSSGGVPHDAGNAGCSTCAAALHGPDHEAAEASFCATGEAFSRWAEFVSCGCAMGGPCALDCAATPYCAGVFPAPGAWADPTGPCAACLEAPGSTGCGDQRGWCEKS